VEALGVEHFGQTGTIDDLYRHHGMDANASDAAEAITAGAPVRHADGGVVAYPPWRRVDAN